MVALAVRDAAFINDVQCSLSYIRFWKVDQGKMSVSTALATWISMWEDFPGLQVVWLHGGMVKCGKEIFESGQTVLSHIYKDAPPNTFSTFKIRTRWFSLTVLNFQEAFWPYCFLSHTVGVNKINTKDKNPAQLLEADKMKNVAVKG